MTAVRFGCDRVAADPARLVPWRRVALVTNDRARLAANPAVRSRVALRAAGVGLVRLFSPEHGLAGDGADGAAMADGTDAATGLPVVSLYGARLAPPPEALADLDAVLFDIPDVGARFYTYAWTLSHMLEECAAAGVPLVVLDRPNPLGGALGEAEGPVLDEDCCASFVGRWAMPVRHALTLGELARHWARTRVRGATVHVVAVDGWHRAMRWPACNLPWVPTSPAMPSYASARLYPGLCLLEGTTASVGRGTARPFQWVGAPWLDPDRVRGAAGDLSALGVALATATMVPAEGPHAGGTLPALAVEVHDEARLRPVALGLRLVAAIAAAHRPDFAWDAYPTAANPSGAAHAQRLLGRRDVAERVVAAPMVDAATIAAWTDPGDWAARVAPDLLYRD